MIRLKAVYLSDVEIQELMCSEDVRILTRTPGAISERVFHKLKKTLESKEYSNVFEA